jgi:glucan 1,3-beta-glucosidase
LLVAEKLTAALWAFARAEAAATQERAAVTHDVAESAHQALAVSDPSQPAKRQRLEDTRIFQPQGLSQSQVSQTQPEEESQQGVLDASAEAAAAHAMKAMMQLLHQGGDSCDVVALSAVLASNSYNITNVIRSMALTSMSYWREVSFDLGRAAISLARFLGHQRCLYWRHAPWRGVNLGGWLLLEPGPSATLFEKYGPAACEWDLLTKMQEDLGFEGTRLALKAHRETFVTEDDFRRIKSLGLNAVRIPFGYWAITGPASGDAFDGPFVEYLDRAVGWAAAQGLQVLLDFHGAPGGESGETPCGRERKEWQWQEWRFDESVSILRTVAARFKGHPAVTGVSVCNEPSETIPAKALCCFYDRAVAAIREAGMRPDEVAITLPVYRTERLDEIWRIWNREFDGFAKHVNVAFDLHLYHCFGPWWERQALPQHLRMTRRHRKILRRVPAVVGEWSLALPSHARGDGGSLEEDQALRSFAASQLDAYGQASHGWFFWNWRDSPLQHAGWDMLKCSERKWLTLPPLDGANAGGEKVEVPKAA